MGQVGRGQPDGAIEVDLATRSPDRRPDGEILPVTVEEHPVDPATDDLDRDRDGSTAPDITDGIVAIGGSVMLGAAERGPSAVVVHLGTNHGIAADRFEPLLEDLADVPDGMHLRPDGARCYARHIADILGLA